MTKILIVDDNLIQRMVLEYNLKRCDYQVEVAVSGKQALEVPQGQAEVSLVITDINMPNINGLELLSLMKSDPRLHDIPVILCTGLSDSENVQKAAQLGCRFYIVKPVQIKVMLQMVQEALAAYKPALEDRKWVLRGLEESRQKLGMDSATLCPVLTGFEQTVNEHLILTERKIKSSDPDSIPWDLGALYENAVLRGAERLASALADIQCGVNMSMVANEDYSTLLDELKALASKLAKMLLDLRSAS